MGILPTTAVFRNKKASKITDAELETFGKCAFELLTKFIQIYGAKNVFIVTNGKAGWVENSLKYMSKRQITGIDYWSIIRKLLQTQFVGQVISARSTYETA